VSNYVLDERVFIDTYIDGGQRDMLYRARYGRALPVPKNVRFIEKFKDEFGRRFVRLNNDCEDSNEGETRQGLRIATHINLKGKVIDHNVEKLLRDDKEVGVGNDLARDIPHSTTPLH
jgi:hypothetical protein